MHIGRQNEETARQHRREENAELEDVRHPAGTVAPDLLGSNDVEPVYLRLLFDNLSEANGSQRTVVAKESPVLAIDEDVADVDFRRHQSHVMQEQYGI